MADEGHDVTFEVGSGQQTASLGYDEEASVSSTDLSCTVDKSVVDPLAPAASSTFIQSDQKPTGMISYEDSGDMFPDMDKPTGDDKRVSLRELRKSRAIRPPSDAGSSQLKQPVTAPPCVFI